MLLPNQSTKIKLLTKEYDVQTTTALAVIFSTYEPIAQALQLTPADYYIIDKELILHCIGQQLSHIAVDEASDMVIAFMLGTDWKINFHASCNNYSPKGGPIKFKFQINFFCKQK